MAAVVATVPAIRHAHTDFLAAGAPGSGEAAPGDHLQTAYRLWLPGHQIEELEAPWRDPYSFQPEAQPQLNPAAWPLGLLFWPLWRALGIVVAWNVLLLLGLIAAGVVTYLWLRELDLHVGAALAGGLAFELAPYRLAQSAEHLLGPISALLPLALWALERARRGSRWWLVLSAVALVSIPASGQLHFAGGAIAFFLAYALVRAPRKRWPLVGALAGTALAVAAGVLLRLFTTDGTIAEEEQPLRRVGSLSADWLDFVRRDVTNIDTFTFLGWLTPLVAIAGLGLLVWRRRYGLAALLGVGAAGPMLLALGTTTPLYEAVRFAVWPLRFVSVPGRLLPVACLAIAALVAFAVDELLKAELPFRTPRKAIVVSAVAIVALLADLRVTAFEPTAADEGNDAYAALRDEPAGRVLELPVFRPDVRSGSAYLYYATQAKRERPLGYSSVAPTAADDLAKELAPLNCGEWTPEATAALERLGVSAITFHGGLYRDNPSAPDTAAFAWRGLTDHGYRLQAIDGPVALFVPGVETSATRAPEEPPRDTAVFCAGWAPNVGNGRLLVSPRGSLWAYSPGGADLRLFVNTKEATTVAVTVDGGAGLTADVSELGEVRVPVGAEGWHLVTLEAPEAAELRVLAYALG